MYKIAGTGVFGYNGNNIKADTAKLYWPEGLACDVAGNVYVADAGNKRVRKINVTTGIITNVAGNFGGTGLYPNGILAINSELMAPKDIAFDQNGNMYIADGSLNRIRKVNTLGIINTVAGNGSSIYNGDGIPATTAALTQPVAITVDKFNNIYFTEYAGHRVREIFANNITSTIVNATCNGACNGSVNASTVGGLAPYTYNWSGGLGSGAFHNNVCANTYSLSITDARAHTQYTTVTVTQPLAITSTITTTNATCGANGAANVLVNGGTLPYAYAWPGGGNVSSTSGLAVGNQTVQITDANNCVATPTFSVIFDPSLFTPAPICMVTVDLLSQHNIVVWDKTVFTNVDSFIVYRETSTNNYNRIAAIAYDSLSQFTDTVQTMYFPNTGDPNSGTYRYKIQARDTCNNYTLLSPYHNTIYIINNGTGTFYWTQLYTIENGANPVSSYILERDDNSNGNWIQIASVAGTQQTINDPLYAIYQNTASWRVRTQWSISCTPTMKTANVFSTSYSNTHYTAAVGIKSNNLIGEVNIFPNPSSGLINVSTTLSGTKKSIEVFSMIGEKVYDSEFTDSNIMIDLSNQSSGVYFINLKTNNQLIVKKIVRK